MEPFKIHLTTFNSLPSSLRKTDAVGNRYVFINGGWRLVESLKSKN